MPKALQEVERCVKCGKVLPKDAAAAPKRLPRCKCPKVKLGPRGHGSRIRKDCIICRDDDLDIIEDEYINWELSAKQIAQRYGFDYRREVLPHLRGRGLVRSRAVNNMPLYLMAQEAAEDAIASGEVSADTALKVGVDVAKHIDKLEGRITHQVEHNASLTLVAPPLPGGAPGSENDEQAVLDAEFEDILAELEDGDDPPQLVAGKPDPERVSVSKGSVDAPSEG